MKTTAAMQVSAAKNEKDKQREEAVKIKDNKQDELYESLVFALKRIDTVEDLVQSVMTGQENANSLELKDMMSKLKNKFNFLDPEQPHASAQKSLAT
jgi:hypothetical protein